jgi:hypothetical protein
VAAALAVVLNGELGDRTSSFFMSARIFILASLVIAVTGCEQQPVTVNRPQYMTAAERVPYVKDFQPSCLVKLRTGADGLDLLEIVGGMHPSI